VEGLDEGGGVEASFFEVGRGFRGFEKGLVVVVRDLKAEVVVAGFGGDEGGEWVCFGGCGWAWGAGEVFAEDLDGMAEGDAIELHNEVDHRAFRVAAEAVEEVFCGVDPEGGLGLLVEGAEAEEV